MAPFHVLWPLSLRLYRSRPAAGDSAAKSRWPHCSPDHGRSHVHFPSTHIPLREHPRSDLQGPRGSGGAGWGGGEGVIRRWRGRGAGGWGRARTLHLGELGEGGPRAIFVHFCSGPYGAVCSFRPICRTLRPPPVQPDPDPGVAFRQKRPY